MRKILTFIMLMVAVAVSAQTFKRLRVYQNDGVVDTLTMTYGSTIAHSRLDLDGQQHPDYVSLIVTTNQLQHQYLLSAIDSLVLPNGHTVVFRGMTASSPLLQEGAGGRLGAPFRTSFSGTFPGGSGVTYYWTENDHIRLDVGYESRAKNLTAGNTQADFLFEDADLDADAYTVYYPDKQVTILSHQTQTGANNTEHIGISGDCGVATATRDNTPPSGGDGGGYSFSLQHKAAYLCFLPYIDHLPSVRLEKIVLNGGTTAGTFQLSEAGLFNGTNTSSRITLDLIPQAENDFFLGHDYRTEQDSVAAYMVIAPQGNTTFTASYYVTDTLSHISKVFHQTFTFTPKANTVYPIRYHISDKEFRMVDLGLSVNWLNANVGGTIPSDYGTQFASDEEANAALLEQTVITEWLMPDEEQQQEILEKCIWTWGQFNGVNGYFVEAPTESTDDGNRHRIFLPSRSTSQVTPEACLAANSRAVETLIVDMGLPQGVKWAVRNVGAQSATDYGDYYAWGETETKSSYTPENYLYGTRNLGENLNISGTQHDAAFVHWGGSWRMPTKSEWENLMNDEYCTWEWQAINGVNGYIVTSKSNGHKIFLPAAGMKYYSSVYYTGSNGTYATANQAGSNDSYTYSLLYYYSKKDIYASHTSEPFSSWDYPGSIGSKRYMGKSVRPVMSPGTPTSDGMELTILTDSASWALGDTEATLYGSLRSTTPIKGEVTVGFVIGDSANITIDELAGGKHNYRSLYSKATTTSGRITYTLPVYDNIGYWYRAFVQTSDTVMYGTPRHYAYEMVDLGLESGTLWANMNLGANTAEESGYCYAWGETEPKEVYLPSTYGFASTSQNIGNNHDITGTKYDAAHVNMGNAWRMPTYNQMNELLHDCSWEHVTQNSTNGYRVTGPNGNTIFLPDAGMRYSSDLYASNSAGIYMTSTQAGNNSEYAYTLGSYDSNLGIYSSHTSAPFNSWDNPYSYASRRDIGKFVRAVASLGNIDGDNAFTILTDSATWKLDDTSATIYGTMSMLRPIEGTVEVGFIVGDSANITKTGAPYYSKHVSDRCQLETTVPMYANMGYWYRAYIDTGDTIFYGESKHFGWEMVDLGLPSGTLWANMNIGASWPENYGNYYAWAETETKEVYSAAAYQYPSTTVNLGDNLNITRTDMDAAHINMGGAWRLPTDVEARELLDNCDWEWVLENGVNGYRVKSRQSGNHNSIFLPAAGFRYEGNSPFYAETGACYQTSVSSGNNSEYAYMLGFYGGNRGVYAGHTSAPFNTWDSPQSYASRRYMGKPVRAVASPNAVMTDGRVLDIQTDSATWKLNATQATLYATVASKQPVSDGLTVGIVLGSSSHVDKASALIDYHQDVTEVCSYSTTVDVTDNMGYWYRAYVEKDGEVKYGEAKHFGWEMVDLGLPSGTKWANMNVGTSWPEEYGDYYAWGETNTKTSYTLDNYQHYVGGAYQNIGNNGDIAATNFDAATVKMGNAWRMPTRTEAQELLDNCSWTWVIANGVNGYRVTGTNGNSIFLPAAGFVLDTTPYYLESGACYATSISGGNGSEYAYMMGFYWGNRGIYAGHTSAPFNTWDPPQSYASRRYMGKPMRAVAVEQ